MTSTLLSMLLVQAMVVIASLAVAVTAPILGPQFGLPLEFASYYATCIFLAAAFAVLPAPLLVARYGALRVSQATLVLAAAGMALLVVDPGTMLVLSGIAVGLSYGPNNPASSHLLAKNTPPHLRARIFSLKQVSVPAGGAIAAAAIPFIAERFGWQSAFVAIAGACLLLSLAIQPLRGKLDADRSSTAGIPLRAFLDPLRMVAKDRRLATLALGSAIYCALQFTFAAMFVTFLAAEAALSLQSAGRTFALATGSSVLARPLWGWLADRLGSTTVLASVGFVMGGASVLAAFIGPGWPFPAILALSCIFGATALGWNGVYLAEVARICAGVNVARATSGTMFVTYLGALTGPLVYGLFVRASGSLALGFEFLGAIAAAGGLMFLAQRRRNAT